MDFSYADLEPIIREKLENGGKVRIKPRGTSMLPMLRQGIDEVELVKPSGKLKKYDIPFYKRKSGQFVLHRIVGKNKDGYILCGDNQFEYEYGITDDMIIAKMSGYYSDGQHISADNADYMKYCKGHVAKRERKRNLLKFKRLVKRIIGRK